jgi:predicted DNA-binding transcriptional regulator AlpA
LQLAGVLSKPSIPDALKNFDSLPDAAHVRQPVVEALFGYSGPTVWRRVRDGRIPRPKKLSPRVTAWNVGELRRVLAAHVAGKSDEEVRELIVRLKTERVTAYPAKVHQFLSLPQDAIQSDPAGAVARIKESRNAPKDQR